MWCCWLPRLRRNSKLHAAGFGKGLMKVVLSIQQRATTTISNGYCIPKGKSKGEEISLERFGLPKLCGGD